MVLLAVLLWAALSFRCQYWLLMIESKSLFLYSFSFLKTHLTVAGGFLTYISAFLTQFLHIPALGAFLWTVCAIILTHITCRTFNIRPRNRIWAIILPVLALAATASLGQNIYLLSDPGFFFRPIIGCIAMISAIRLYSILHSEGKGIPAAAFLTLTGFYLFGIFASAAAIAMIIRSWSHRHSTRNAIVTTLIISVLTALSPYIWYNILITENLKETYLAGFPEYTVFMREVLQWLPYLLTALFIFLLSALPDKKGNATCKYPQALPMTAALITAFLILYIFTYRNPLYRTELEMAVQTDRADWNGILDTAEKFDAARQNEDQSPSRLMVLYRNLALIRTGREGDEAFHFRESTDAEKSMPNHISLMLKCGKQLYFHYGIPDYCFRWSMEESVSQGFSYNTLKYMTLASIVTGDTLRADTYNSQLRHTLFYKKTIDENTDIYAGVLPLLCTPDRLAMDNDLIEIFLAQYFTGHLDSRTTPEFDRTALFFALQHKQPALFWNHFVKYLNSNNPDRLPTAYQEAVILFTEIADIPAGGLALDRTTTERWNEFLEFAHKHPANSSDWNASVYRSGFEDTYWYFYYFINDITTY